MYGGQSSKGFLVDHHLLLNKQRNDTKLNRDVVENTVSIPCISRPPIFEAKNEIFLISTTSFNELIMTRTQAFFTV